MSSSDSEWSSSEAELLSFHAHTRESVAWHVALMRFNLAMAEESHAHAAHHLMVMLDLHPSSSSKGGALFDVAPDGGGDRCVEDEVMLACQLKLENAMLRTLRTRFSAHVLSRASSMSPRRAVNSAAAAVEAAEGVRVLWERCSVLGLGPKARAALTAELAASFDRRAAAHMAELDSVREIQSAAARQRKDVDATMGLFARTRRPVAAPKRVDVGAADDESVGAARAYLAAVSKLLDEASDAMGQVEALGLDEESQNALRRAVNVKACVPVARALNLFLEHRTFSVWVQRVESAGRAAEAEYSGGATRDAAASAPPPTTLDAAVVDALLDEAALLCQMCHRYLSFVGERDAAMAKPTDAGIGPLYIPLESLIAEYLLLEQAFLGYASSRAFAASRAAFYAPRHNEAGKEAEEREGEKAEADGGGGGGDGGGADGGGGGDAAETQPQTQLGRGDAANGSELEPTTGAVVDDVVFIVHKATQRASITLSARAAEAVLSQAIALLEEKLHAQLVRMSRSACTAVTFMETGGISSVLVAMVSVDAVPDEEALRDAIVMLNTLDAAPTFLRTLHRELSEGVVRACFSETWEQFAVPLAALERLSGRFTASAASEIKRAADTILAPLVREVVSGAMAEAAYDLDESAFTLCEARDPWAKFLIDQLFGLDVMRMFDQLCNPGAFADLVCGTAALLGASVEEGFVSAAAEAPVSVFGAIQIEREVRVLERAMLRKVGSISHRLGAESAGLEDAEAQRRHSAFAARTKAVQANFGRLRHMVHILNVEQESDLEREETKYPHAPVLSAVEITQVLEMRAQS